MSNTYENKALDAKAFKFLQRKIEASSVSGETIKTLTTDDYDIEYNGTKVAVATWRLPVGIYRVDVGVNLARTLKAATPGYNPLNFNESYVCGTRLLLIEHGARYKSSVPNQIQTDGVEARLLFRKSRYFGQELDDTYRVAPVVFGNIIMGNFDASGNPQTTYGDGKIYLDFGSASKRALFSDGSNFLVGPTELNDKLGISNLEVGDGLKITTTGSGANTKVKIELVSSDEESF